MLEGLREWTIQIAGVIIFSSICEMVIPNSSIKKYIHMVLGMILILTVVRPLCFGQIEDNGGIFGNLERYDAYTSHINMDEMQKEQVIKLYSNKLCDEIESAVNSVSESDNAEVSIVITTENIESFGEIEQVTVEVDEADLNAKDEIRKMIQNTYGVGKENIDIRGR